MRGGKEMRIVDQYIEKLYKEANPRLNETKELKEETRIHLNESIRELMTEGHSVDEAFNIAVERFGGFEQAEKLISLMQIHYKTFANRLLKIGIIILILVSILFFYMLYIGNLHDARFAETGYKIGESFSSINSKKIESFIKEESFILEATIYEGESNPLNPVFTFVGNKLWVPQLFITEAYYKTNEYFVSLEVVDVRTVGFFLFAIGFTIYYVLSTVWGLIRLYHADKLKLIWILMLLLLNVIGYALFFLKNKSVLS